MGWILAYLHLLFLMLLPLVLPTPDDPFYAPSSWCSLLLMPSLPGAHSSDYSFFLLLPAPDALSPWFSLLVCLLLVLPLLISLW